MVGWAVTVNCSPARSTARVTGRPWLSLMASETSVQVVVARSLMVRISSPVLRPTCSATEPGVISPIFVESTGSGRPTNTNRVKNSSTANTRLNSGPPKTMPNRCHTGLCEKERCWSAACTSSPSCSPYILT